MERIIVKVCTESDGTGTRMIQEYGQDYVCVSWNGISEWDSLGSEMFVVVEYLFTEFVDELIKAQVHLGFYFIVEELLAKVMQGIVSTVTVQIQGVQYVPGDRERQTETHEHTNVDKF